MMISNGEQLILLLRCLGCGVWLDLTWVLLEQIRRRYIRTKALRFLFDGVCAILSGFGIFLFSLAVSGGELRAVMLLAIGVGAYVSHLSVGRLFSLLLRAVCRVIGMVCGAWERGLQKGVELWRKIRKKVEFFSKKSLQNGRSWVYNRNNK